MSKHQSFTKDFSSFVSDLGDFIWAMRAAHHYKAWDRMARDCLVCPSTLTNLAKGRTRNPQLYTCWKILKQLDNLGIIQHSRLERYRAGSNVTKFPRKRRAA